MKKTFFAFLALLNPPVYAAMVEIEVEPYQAINAHFIAYAHIGKDEHFSTLDIQRTQDGQTVKSFALGQLKDKDPRPEEYQWHLLTFLPLGEYRVALGGGKTSVVSNNVDTHEFIPTLTEQTKQADHSDVNGLVFTRSDGIPKEAIAGEIKPLAPFGKQADPKPVFRWRTENAVKDMEYYLYVFQGEDVVWEAVVTGTEVRYGGPTLKSGETYRWILGVEKDGKVWELRAVGEFQF